MWGNSNDYGVSPGDTVRKRPTTGNNNVAAKTGITYISGTMTRKIEIPIAILGLSTRASARKVCPGYCHILILAIVVHFPFWLPNYHFRYQSPANCFSELAVVEETLDLPLEFRCHTTQLLAFSISGSKATSLFPVFHYLRIYLRIFPLSFMCSKILLLLLVLQ